MPAQATSLKNTENLKIIPTGSIDCSSSFSVSVLFMLSFNLPCTNNNQKKIFLYSSIPFNSICDEFEEMSMHAGERPKETAEVVALQNYLNECKEKRIVKLKNEIKTAAERVVFLLYHATLDGNHYDRSRTNRMLSLANTIFGFFFAHTKK